MKLPKCLDHTEWLRETGNKRFEKLMVKKYPNLSPNLFFCTKDIISEIMK